MSGIKAARDLIEGYDGPKVRIMEVCGTHTHEIFRQGIRQLLPEKVSLISGPGCPVCVTAVSFIDEAVWLALQAGCTVATFGDLVRVPGSASSLALARGQGGKVRVVYSAMDALSYAKEHREEEVVFLSVGFETTTPSAVLAVRKAMEEGVKNFSLLTANKTMPAAYEAMMHSTDAYLYPGHVCAVVGTKDCREMLARGMSGVVAGFTGEELILALAVILKRFPEGKPFFENCYPRVVRAEGSPAAIALVEKFMTPCDDRWRGIGVLKNSGLRLKDEYSEFDARKRFSVPCAEGKENKACRCGEVLQGKCLPGDCPVYGKACTPEHPVGACMVSSEGACSAFYLYGRNS